MNAESLTTGLEHSDAETRRQAIASLPNYKGEGDIGAWILRGLGDADWRVRKEATRVAHEIGSRENLVPRFVGALLQGDNVGLRNSALDVLAHLGPQVIDYVLEVFPGMQPAQQKFLLDALGETRDERVVHLLVSLP